MRSMILAGMDVARFNFSHGTQESHLEAFQTLSRLREDLKVPVASLLDTKGPEIRLGLFQGGGAQLEAGSRFTLVTEECQGDASHASITFPGLVEDVKAGDTILLNDGAIALRVESVSPTAIDCVVQNGGYISDRKGVNVPGVRLSMPYISEKDRSDILFGAKMGFDFIAASFARRAQDILEIRQLLERQGNQTIRIIAKIENAEGVSNADEILRVSDGIMVARGDMGVEIPFEEVPIQQKILIKKCYAAGKMVITATQMLESMMEHPRPTRAEITDVANAIYDGTSAIMLSGETAAGRWPVQAVQTMAAIAWRTESDINYGKRLRQRTPEAHMSVADAVAHAACTTAMDIHANAIITVTKSGETARLLCKYRPNTDILACTLTRQVFRQLSLSWGITPLCMEYAHNTDELIDKAVATAKKAQMVADGDLVVLTAGVPVGISGTTNMIKAHLVGDALLTGVGVGSKNGTGRACVCHNAEEANHKCKDGDVLVVPATDNEMLTAVRHAAAIITEEAGANSHAAIVGLTLGKPVIVGALGATRKLEDGMHISVDAERGVVRAMPD